MKRFIVLCIILSFSGLLYGASTLKWQFNTYKKFEKGDFFNVSLTEDGELTLSPELESIKDIDCMYIWDIKTDSKGNIYIATGNDGIIYRIDRKGNVSKFFETASIAAFKILIDKKNNLYVSTLTRGLVYKISPDGKGDVFFVFKGDYIWDMIFDRKGDIILATGIPGALYRLNINNKELEEICVTKEMHILSVIQDKEGDFYFGTSDKGALYKYSVSEEKLNVIYQTGENEVHTLILRSDGVIFAGTSDREFKFPYKRRIISQSESDEKKELKADIYKKLKPPSNCVYKIMPSGYVTKIIELRDTIFLSFIFDQQERLYVGTGDAGVIYRCDKNDRVEKIVEMDESQIISFARTANNEILVGTGNIGSLYKLKINYAEFGNYISEVLDAGGWARWGRIRWDWNQQDNTIITVQTRSGNTSEVDDTWSEWSEEYKDSQGSVISSPSARFLQFKINFKTSAKKLTPILYSIEIPYLLNNRPPEITRIEFKYPVSKTLKKTGTVKSSSSVLKQWERKIKWKAQDPDNDKLVYSVFARIEDSGEWILLKDELTTTEYVLDVRKLPDGIYQFKVIADDLPDNSQGYNLKSEKVSKKYIIDTTPPEIIELKWERIEKNTFKIEGKVVDNLSRIISISYSIDAKKWINIFPKDLLFDSSTEEFEFIYKNSTKPNIIMIMGIDEWNNITTRYVKIRKSK